MDLLSLILILVQLPWRVQTEGTRGKETPVKGWWRFPTLVFLRLDIPGRKGMIKAESVGSRAFAL